MVNCSVEGCGGGIYSKGMCSRHYNRLRTTGTTADGPKAKLPFRERLWKKIDRRGPDDCWEWKSKSLVKGYGAIGTGGRSGKHVLAHRAVWEEFNGPIPKHDSYHGHVIMHTCDNRLCCNPSHLVLGTQSDNVRDMDKKGRRINSWQGKSRKGIPLRNIGLQKAGAIRRYSAKKTSWL